MATEAAWLNGEKERNTHVKSKTLNKQESAPEFGGSFGWSFVAAHFDSHANICYVRYNRLVRGLGATLEQIKIDDIEGNHIAGYSAIWASDRDGNPTYARPSECKGQRNELRIQGRV